MFFIKITDGQAKLFRDGRKTGNVRAKYCLFGGKTLFYACKIYCVMIKYLLIYVKTGIGRFFRRSARRNAAACVRRHINNMPPVPHNIIAALQVYRAARQSLPQINSE